jgi:hypothetical protein
MRTLAFLLCLAFTSSAPAAEEWLKLYDGESLFGWKTTGNVKATPKGMLIPQGGEAEVLLPVLCELEFVVQPSQGRMRCVFEPLDTVNEETFGMGIEGSEKPTTVRVSFKPGAKGVTVISKIGRHAETESPEWMLKNNRFLLTFRASDKDAVISQVRFRPLETKPLFNGKNLDGWKLFDSDAAKAKSKFDVTQDGELRVDNGPGDLQTTGKYADFCLQFECKTLGPALNSGIFFRCLPGQYQAGYEAQIQNAFKDNDRTKPADFGTGAIYRRVPTRKVVSNDNEWFTMTVLAMGPRLRTWVNGYPTVDWTDDRKADENARKGLKLDAGHLSIQGHDPTTNILFRNLRIQELK